MHPVQDRGLGMKFNLLFVLFTFLAHRFLPKYDIRMQLLMFQIKMLRDRIDDQRIVPTPEERAMWCSWLSSRVKYCPHARGAG
jgi:putative transposase